MPISNTTPLLCTQVCTCVRAGTQNLSSLEVPATACPEGAGVEIILKGLQQAVCIIDSQVRAERRRCNCSSSLCYHLQLWAGIVRTCSGSNEPVRAESWVGFRGAPGSSPGLNLALHVTIQMVWPHDPYWSRPHLSGKANQRSRIM